MYICRNRNGNSGKPRRGREDCSPASEFAQNTRYGMPIRSLNSFQPDFELYYSIYAAVAQGEQESARDNVAVAIRQKVKDGTSSLYSRTCYGYKKDENGDFVIVPEEAKTVKLIYDLYLEGNSIVAIRRELEKRSIPFPTGKKGWCARAIDTLLSNEKYRGKLHRNRTSDKLRNKKHAAKQVFVLQTSHRYNR